MKRKRVIILGAAGRDFHNFNLYFRTRKEFEVVAFTGTQIPEIEKRRYPKELAGELYPEGIPIYPEVMLPELIRDLKVDLVVFSYSDVSHNHVMHLASTSLAGGADFLLLGPEATMLRSKRKVIAVGAVRTGSGKSQTTRKVCSILKSRGVRYAVVRHPMPYGDLVQQRVQRFETLDDLIRNNCTIEEQEEYEPHLRMGSVVYAGVDYEAILKEAEKGVEVIVWDGGNNDLPFFKPDLLIVVTDPHRVGDELTYHPGETILRMADIVIINKIDSAKKEQIEQLRENIRSVNRRAAIIEARSPITVDNPELLPGKRALIIEDGPTLTHGGMPYGAGYLAATKAKVKEIIDPRPFAVGSIKKAYEEYPQIGKILPALGYGKKQLKELAETIHRSDAEVVVIGTPVDLRRVIDIEIPAVRITYELEEKKGPRLEDFISDLIRKE
ncbi:GTPase [candidate division WOR-3 bacterium]|uniref:GTPase n=1 Tax=candidate division WOR-3 bacterium TaxID=2052148 RepID=A0A660SH46_UNCW3|nr:MAG: GTPase [candidate division WOR-3 bacterium]